MAQDLLYAQVRHRRAGPAIDLGLTITGVAFQRTLPGVCVRHGVGCYSRIVPTVSCSCSAAVGILLSWFATVQLSEQFVAFGAIMVGQNLPLSWRTTGMTVLARQHRKDGFP